MYKQFSNNSFKIKFKKVYFLRSLQIRAFIEGKEGRMEVAEEATGTFLPLLGVFIGLQTLKKNFIKLCKLAFVTVIAFWPF